MTSNGVCAEEVWIADELFRLARRQPLPQFRLTVARLLRAKGPEERTTRRVKRQVALGETEA